MFKLLYLGVLRRCEGGEIMAAQDNKKGSFADLDAAAKKYERREKARAKRARETGRKAVVNEDEYYEW